MANGMDDFINMVAAESQDETSTVGKAAGVVAEGVGLIADASTLVGRTRLVSSLIFAKDEPQEEEEQGMTM